MSDGVDEKCGRSTSGRRDLLTEKLGLDCLAPAAYLRCMKINDAYLRLLLTIALLCLIAITIKYVMSESGKAQAQASVTLLPPAPLELPTAPAPRARNQVGFTARPFTTA